MWYSKIYNMFSVFILLMALKFSQCFFLELYLRMMNTISSFCTPPMVMSVFLMSYWRAFGMTLHPKSWDLICCIYSDHINLSGLWARDSERGGGRKFVSVYMTLRECERAGDCVKMRKNIVTIWTSEDNCSKLQSHYGIHCTWPFICFYSWESVNMLTHQACY